MATAFLVNPRRKSRRRKHRVSAHRKIRRNPRRKASAPVAPTRRKRRSKRRAGRIASVRKRIGRSVKRGGMGGVLNQEIMPAVTGAAGALTVDVLMGYIPFPASVNTPTMRPLLKGLVAVGLGLAAAKFGKAKLGRDLAVGALTVAMHDSGRGLVQKILPTANLGYYNPGNVTGVGEYVNGMGEYVNGIPFMGSPSFMGGPINPFPSMGFQSGNFGLTSQGMEVAENFDY